MPFGPFIEPGSIVVEDRTSSYIVHCPVHWTWKHFSHSHRSSLTNRCDQLLHLALLYLRVNFDMRGIRNDLGRCFDRRW